MKEVNEGRSMSSQVCPFCGKSFKRLKSHLPHCKAATGSSKSAPHDQAKETKNRPKHGKTQPPAREPPLETKADQHRARTIAEDAEPQSEKQTFTPVAKKSANSQNAKRTKQVNHISTNESGANATEMTTSESRPKSQETDPRSKGGTKVTLEDVRTTLRRAQQNGGSKRDISVATDAGTDQNEAENLGQREVASRAKRPAAAPQQTDVFISSSWRIEDGDCSFTQGRGISCEGLRMDRHSMGRAAAAAMTFLEAEVSPRGFGKDPLSPARNANVAQEARRGATGAGESTRAALAQQRLGQVTLKELPDWLVLKSPRRPGEVMDMVQRGWQWYYRRYIDVKRGGVGGVAMLLAGYCVLSYAWTYPHLKQHRHRKYH